jgi:hypothetical protein
MKNPGSLPFLGHCWRSALLAAFRLVGFVRGLRYRQAGSVVLAGAPAVQLVCVWCLGLARMSILNLDDRVEFTWWIEQ